MSLKAVALFAVACVACNSSETVVDPAPNSSSSSSSSSGGSSSSSSSSGGTNTNTGSFKPKSSFFFKDRDGTYDLIFSDQDGACDDAKNEHLGAGETLVQFYELGTSGGPAQVGTVTPADKEVKYAHVSASCKSGDTVGDSVNIDKTSDGKTSTVKFTSITDSSVKGHVTLTFADGANSFDADFDAPACSVTTPEHQTCR